MQSFRIFLKSKEIDTIFYSDDIKIAREEVYNSLVDHDGYDPEIRVVKARRKMKTGYVIQGNYGGRWEDVSTEETKEDARRCLEDYRVNEPQYLHRLIRRRIPV